MQTLSDSHIQLPQVPLLQGREEILINKSKGKRVLHLGCVDTGLTEKRLVEGTLLHHKLAAVTDELWGLDINADGIAFLTAHGFKNLITGDVCSPNIIPAFQGQNFQVIIASELIEHLSNPGGFLTNVRSLMTPMETEFIVSVPNAFSLSTLFGILRSIENVHPDHNYYFSYYTITNLLQKYEFDISHVYAYSFQATNLLPTPFLRLFRKKQVPHPTVQKDASLPVPASSLQRTIHYVTSLPRHLLLRILYRQSPFWGDGIIVTAYMKQETTSS